MKTLASDDRPRVDDRIVQPESRAEIVRGILLMSPPADEPHATVHFTLAHVLAAHVAPGYRGAVDMLTRTSRESDFAPDASVFPEAGDARTGGRQLEELAFEIASTQPLDSAGEKARELVRRGVRRVFCLVVRHGRVLEWSAETDAWSPLPDSAEIEDRCFVRPLPVRALLDAAATDAAVIAAFDARRSPALRAVEARGEARGRAEGEAEGRARGEAEGRARGEALGRAAALLTVLRARGLAPSPAQRARIEAADVATLDAWIDRSPHAASVDDLLGG